MCELLDYGVDAHCAYLVMPKYQGSLRQWRVQQTCGLQENLGLYLRVFASVCGAVKVRRAARLPSGACLTHACVQCLRCLHAGGHLQ